MDQQTERPALDSVRVLDASTGIAGPVAAMLLGDFGAQVIRVQEPGDWADELPGAVVWHRNKTIVPQAEAAGLVASADVVLTSDAATAEAIGLSLRHEPPAGLVHLYLPDWHEELDLDPLTRDRMVAADYGVARRQTSFSGGPIDSVYPFLSYMHGAWGAACGIAALVERARAGHGQRVVVDALHGTMVAAITTMMVSPTEPLPSTTVGPGGPNPTFGTYRCADDEWLFLGALGSKFQDIAFGLLGTADILDDPRIAGVREQLYAPGNRDWVRARLTEAFLLKPRAQWLTALADAGCPASPVGDRDDWLDHPQVAALGQRMELDDPVVGPSVTVGVPVDLSRGARPVHRARTFASSAAWQERPGDETPPAQATATSGGGPLGGLRVLDLGTVLAGPYSGMLLAALGADVVKVETVKGDELRVRGYGIARGQRGLGIDLRDPQGYDAFLRLVGASDVVLDNYRPGVLERLRLDDATLRRAKPDIVTTSITGYGDSGPLGGHPGYDPVVQALAGIMRGQGGQAEPVFSTLAINDVTVACLAALGTCAALYQRAVGRGGQHVSSSLATAATFMQSGELVRYAGRPPAETGGRDHPGPSALSRFYRCADGWVRIHLRSAQDAVAAGLIGDAAAPDDELAARLERVLGGLTQDRVRELAASAGGVATRARDYRDLVSDPLTHAGGHICELVWPDGNSTFLPHELATFSRRRRPDIMTATGHGEYSREILTAAGLDREEIEQLISSGAVVVGEPMYSVVGVGYR
ncbi:CoA transferase [Dactylosporangium sp. AC04546]|uniref:CoA transferase n=1 Tax=Dactylosporangium sp. AC04546 TaxID=2862460 RepID=UPI001EE07AC1|nr:CoA transferase [Dactylosporangium sp. AC04546]WVK80771.1 CoA transferase [Dactylosporangium sp. AC04546]